MWPPRMMLSFLFDPSWIFGLLCVVTPPLMACTPLINLSQIAPRLCDISGHFLNPLPIVSAFLCMMWALYCQHDGVALSPRDQRVANWYLVNAFIFKSIMDTFAGSLQLWPMMTAQYNMLDPRYPKALTALDSIPVHLTSALEMCVMVPLCLLTYRAYHRGSSNRYVLEVVVATLQATGTYYFYLAGILTQHDNLLQMARETNTFDFAFYFCFANLFCPILWIIVPISCILTASADIVRLANDVDKVKRF